jgi:hypothetical protein
MLGLGLQGVAVTIGKKIIHLFYLCAECGDVDIEELLKIITSYKKTAACKFELNE